MLLMWAIFTIGYILGVFVTLKVFVTKDNLSEDVAHSADFENLQYLSNEEVHKKLIEVNFNNKPPKDNNLNWNSVASAKALTQN